MRCTKVIFGVTHFSDRTVAKHFEGLQTPGLKPQFVIDKGEQRLTFGRIGHFLGFGDVHRHRLFAENVFAEFQGEQRYLAVQLGRRGDAYEVDVVAWWPLTTSVQSRATSTATSSDSV